MNNLSVYFGSKRTYLCVTEPTDKGLKINYVNASEQAIDLEDPEAIDTMIASDDIKEMLDEIGEVSRVSVTLPADSVLVTKIPGKKDMSLEEKRKLVEIEIKHSFPQFNYRDFIPSVINFAPKIDGKEIMLATIIPKQDFVSCKEILSSADHPINSIEISQLNAHASFLYNYPELRDKNVAIVGVADKFLDISVITNGKPVYYNLAKLNDKEMIGDVCLEEIAKITEKYIKNVDAVYLFGESLDIDLLVIAQSMIMMSVPVVGKLNAFRMFTTDLDQRHKDYMSRVAHLFPPCIGGNLPGYGEKTNLY